LKYILIILLFLSSCVPIPAQDTIAFDGGYTIKRTGQSRFVPLAIFISSIALNACGDGLNDSGKKIEGHILNACSVGVLLMSPFILKLDRKKWLPYLVSYTFIRIALFDPIYNTSRGLPFEYLGNSSLTDKAFKSWGGLGMFERGVCFVVGFSIPLNEF
jgi:hypothetical protein